MGPPWPRLCSHAAEVLDVASEPSGNQSDKRCSGVRDGGRKRGWVEEQDKAEAVKPPA